MHEKSTSSQRIADLALTLALCSAGAALLFFYPLYHFYSLPTAAASFSLALTISIALAGVAFRFVGPVARGQVLMGLGVCLGLVTGLLAVTYELMFGVSALWLVLATYVVDGVLFVVGYARWRRG